MAETSTLAVRPHSAASRPYGLVSFGAMASPCRIVTDNDELAAAGAQFVHGLEQRWSRFLPDSEISALNESSGSLCVVSDTTFRLVELAERARCRTHGAFNPLVLDRLEQLGYRSDGSLPGDLEAIHGPPSDPVSQEPITLLAECHAVRLPADTRFDPGGIGKGLAGDLVVDHLIGLGATTIQVELGGDVRLYGENWTGGEWRVGVQDPRDRARSIAEVSVAAGAVATSSVVSATWQAGNHDMHHLLDTATGWPSETDLASVTATSSELWWAEVIAKVALMAGSRGAVAVMREFGASGLLVDRRGTVHAVDGRCTR